MKKIENSFVVTGYIVKDAEVKNFNTASVARFGISVSRPEKKENQTNYVSAFANIEAWKKNEAANEFAILKKGSIVTIEGYFKPEEWTDNQNQKHSSLVMTATKFYLAPDKTV